ncbi:MULTISPECIES: hemerythrin domain-containing protein [Thermomonosporaceae]|uniref:hemerythrin domain-containing protein n=1 Tax=Thermomonosporaceae TaxID=2012 RepID=UPI00255B21D8|nr:MULTISPECIES: hemerythrin domain-containing protein [Thermomonosporaceae]MDL4774101.1 hemerythrin domain-containing protein [Actinomadura xylanilytica]
MAARPDMTMMLVTHKAFRRDLGYLSDAAGRLDAGDARGRQAVDVGWRTLKAMLISHHEGEDRHMWPRMRAGLHGRPDDLAVLDAMEAEHDRIDPLVAAVDDALARPGEDDARPAEAAEEFRAELDRHLEHEEGDALPLVGAAMSPGDWERCLAEMRGGGLAALRSAPEFFPWLIGEAATADRAAVLSRVPPPVRLLFQKVWLPRYTRQPRWL